MKNKYFIVCENCGAHLDPGEVCDCKSEETYTVLTREEYEAEIIALFECTSLKTLDLIYKIMLKSMERGMRSECEK